MGESHDHLIDDAISADRAAGALRAHRGTDPRLHPIEGGDQEDEWLLAEIGRRFDLRPVARGAYGLIVAELVPRSA